ncbi:MAG: protein kinase [Verrucomicrobiales bacterium]|nr:protein kinase [Verrucomicrobiales bacterium]
MSERYEIRGRVGRGGMSAVYRAYDTVMRRDVAIKRLLPVEETNLNENAGNLIEREAAALARFQHPNIVTIYAMEEDKDGPFVVMEMIEGEDLHAVMEEGALSWEDFKDVAPQCLEPLIAASELNLLHRDLKPGNIMLTMTPSDRFLVKILDFGLAKFSQQPSLQTLDQKGSFLGSIDYIAPEQLELKPLDQRTDLYSLGCVLYYSLAQKAPFTGGNPARTSMNHLKHKCVHISELRPDVPRPVADWLMRMISREVEDRPRDAAEALEDLQQALNGGEDKETGKSGEGTSNVLPSPIATGEVAPTTPAPVDDVLPPGEEAIPVAKVVESSKPKILTTPSPEKSRAPKGPKMVVPGKTAAATVPAKKAVPTPPARPPVKRAKQPESPAKGFVIPLVVGSVLIVLISVIALINRPKDLPPPQQKQSQVSGQKPKAPAKPKQAGATQSGKAAATPTNGPLPLPSKMVWREGNLPVAVIPDGEGMLLRFSANRFVMNRSYQGIAKPGDKVAAWGDMVMRNLKWSMVRDIGDKKGLYLPLLTTVTREQIEVLRQSSQAVVLNSQSALNVAGTDLGSQPEFTLIVVARVGAGGGKLLRLNEGAGNGLSFDLASSNTGQLTLNIRDQGELAKASLKWGKDTAGVICLRFNSESGVVHAEGIRANGTLPDPVALASPLRALPMQKICIGNRAFASQPDAKGTHHLFEFIVYTAALSDDAALAIQSSLVKHYFAPGS